MNRLIFQYHIYFEPTKSTTLKNLEHIASPTQETNYNKDIVKIEMNDLSPNKNSKSAKKTHKTSNEHHINIKKKERKKKSTKLKQATVTTEIYNNILKTLNNMGSISRVCKETS